MNLKKSSYQSAKLDLIEHSLKEKEILEKIREPESKQFGFSLLVSYQKPLYTLIRRMVVDHDDADDIIQDTFVKVWKNLGSLPEDARLFT